MSEVVSTTLRAMREARGWSLGRLARAAGVHASTLSRWESGARQPCVPELESVLDALQVSPEQRVTLMAALRPPRAARRLSQIVPAVGLPAPPATGDLLRALRQRSGLTQEQVAAAVGVSRTVLTRWERGERVPDAEERQALCFHLGAREAEIVAITVAADRDPDEPQAALPWPDRRDRLLQRLTAVNTGQFSGSDELYYLLLERDAWHAAVTHSEARQVLAGAYAHHAHFLGLNERWRDSRPIAERAMDLAGAPGGDLITFLRAVLVKASVLSHAGDFPGTTAALRLLRPVAAREDVPPEYSAWALSAMAECLGRAGFVDASIAASWQACRVARACANPMEAHLRRCNLGERLLDAGRPLEALRVAPEPPADHAPVDRLPALLLLARAHHASGNRREAEACLRHILELTEDPALRRWRARAESLAARF